MRYAPQNELGVVFLFAQIAKRKGLKVDEIRPTFPDCIAYRNTGTGEKRIRIEFEYKSRNFRQQRHNPRDCDCIVCWEHNWHDAPANIEVIELRREFGLGFNVWIQPVSNNENNDFSDILEETNSSDWWSVPSLAQKGDLLLFYHASPKKYIGDIFKLVGDVRKKKAGWKKGQDYMGPIRRVCQLKSPIFLDDLKRHKILSTAFFVRDCMRGRPRVTEYWPYLYEMIIRRNQELVPKLKKYDPSWL